jgi:hypothetical protein
MVYSPVACMRVSSGCWRGVSLGCLPLSLPLARATAVVVSLLLVVGLAFAGAADVILAGIAPDWVRASVPLVLVFVRFPLYWIVTRWDRRP